MNTNRKITDILATIVIATAFCQSRAATNNILDQFSIQFAYAEYGSTQNDNSNVLCFTKLGQSLIPKSSSALLPLDSIKIVSATSPDATNPSYASIPDAQFQQLSKTITKLMLASKVQQAIRNYDIDHSAGNGFGHYPNDIGAKSTSQYLAGIIKENYIDQKLADKFLTEFVIGNVKSEEGVDGYPVIVSKNAISGTANSPIIAAQIYGIPTTYTIDGFAQLPKIPRSPQFLPLPSRKHRI